MPSEIYEFFRDQGSILAGLLALIAAGTAGGLAYQVGRQQVRGIGRQLAAMRARDDEIDRRKTIAICWALRAGAVSISTGAMRRRELIDASRPGGAVYLPRDLFKILVPGVLRGEREDLALLTPKYQTSMATLALRLDDYNAVIDALPPGREDLVRVDDKVPDLLSDLQRDARQVARLMDEELKTLCGL